MSCPNCGVKLEVSPAVAAAGAMLAEAGRWCRCGGCGSPFLLRYFKDAEHTYIEIKMFGARYEPGELSI